MKRNPVFALVLIFLLLSSGLTARAQSPEISEIVTVEKVERIISSLSSDDMRGRRVFTPALAAAGRYIEGRFREIGLEYLDGTDSYRQKFILYLLEPEQALVQLNGEDLSRDRFFTVTRHESVSWADLSTVESRTISESDNFAQAFRETNASQSDLLVLVDPSHKNQFARYAEYFGGGSRGFEVDEGPSRLYILSDSDQADSGSFYLSNEVGRRQLFNVAGQITGTEYPDEYVLFTAHYDHIGILNPVQGDSIANGADDNASGTTAVIALAEYFKELGPQSRTTVFVAFTAEEIGGYGSQHFSRQMDPEQVVAMFNIEMIGKPSKFGPNTAFMTGFNMTDMGAIMQQTLEDTPYMVYPDPYPEQNLFFRSDNATLARQGVPAHSFSSVEIDKDTLYHTVNDELQYVDLEHLTNMIRAIGLSSREIVSAEATPTRIDPAKLN